MDVALYPESTVVVADRNVSYTLEGEAVVLDLGEGVYYSLNPVAARVWELLHEPRTVAEILTTLLEEYDVEAARCETDLLHLLRGLAARELIKTSTG